jgi:hypothetical protein
MLDRWRDPDSVERLHGNHLVLHKQLCLTAQQDVDLLGLVVGVHHTLIAGNLPVDDEGEVLAAKRAAVDTTCLTRIVDKPIPASTRVLRSVGHSFPSLSE